MNPVRYALTFLAGVLCGVAGISALAEIYWRKGLV